MGGGLGTFQAGHPDRRRLGAQLRYRHRPPRASTAGRGFRRRQDSRPSRWSSCIKRHWRSLWSMGSGSASTGWALVRLPRRPVRRRPALAGGNRGAGRRNRGVRAGPGMTPTATISRPGVQRSLSCEPAGNRRPKMDRYRRRGRLREVRLDPESMGCGSGGRMSRGVRPLDNRKHAGLDAQTPRARGRVQRAAARRGTVAAASGDRGGRDPDRRGWLGNPSTRPC